MQNELGPQVSPLNLLRQLIIRSVPFSVFRSFLIVVERAISPTGGTPKTVSLCLPLTVHPKALIGAILELIVCSLATTN